MIDLAALHQRGYTAMDRLIDVEVLAEFELVMARLGEVGLERKGLSPQAADAMTDLLKTGGDYRARLFANLKNLQIVQEMGHCVSERLAADGFLDWAELIAPVIYPTLRADVPGETRYLLPMHQDYATQCRKAWRIWIPLRPANAQNGTMQVVPGSHHAGYIEHDTTDPAKPFVSPDRYGWREPLVLDLAAGDGILLDPLLVHGSVPADRDCMKYVLLVQIQDLTTMADPDDPDDPLPARLAMTAIRDHYRG